MQDFAAAEEHADAAYALDPADPAIRALKATVDYRRGGDGPRRRRWRWPAAWSPRRRTWSPAQMVLIADRLEAGAPPRRSR